MKLSHNSLHPKTVSSSVKCFSTACCSWQLSKGCASYPIPYILSQIIANKNKLKFKLSYMFL